MSEEITQLKPFTSIVPRPSSTPMDIVRHAVENGASIEVLEKLMALQERHDANMARKAFDEAMAEAKAEIPTINKNRTVDFTSQKGRTNYRYEDLGEIARTVDPILSKHGLSYRFRTSSAIGEPITVTCIVSHRGGHSEENTLIGPRDESGNKNALQAIGSTVTFLQRYSLKAALGLAASLDDDGAAVAAKATITDDQVTEIGRLILATKTEVGKFCAAMGVECVPDLPADKFDLAIGRLRQKERAMKAAEAPK